jgi:hypothetical protein
VVFVTLNFALSALSAVAFYLTGRAVTKFVKLRVEGVAERLAIYPAFGMAVYALAFTAIGFAGLYNRPVAYAVLGIGLMFGFVNGRSLAAELGETINRFKTTAADIRHPIRPFLVAAVFILTSVVAVVALLPQLWWDVLSYHLTLPLKYILAERLYYVPDIRASSFPQYQEQLNLWGMLLYSTRLAPLFAILTWNVTFVTVYSAGRRIYGKEAGFYGAAVFIATPFILFFVPYGVNDHWWAMYFALSLYFVLRWYEKDTWQDLIAAAMLTGLAFGSKILQGFLIPIYVLVLITAAYASRKGVVKSTVSLIVFGVLIFAVASPWFLRNWVHTGELLGFITDDYTQVSMWRGEGQARGVFERFLWFFSLPTFRGPGLSLWNLVKTPFLITVGRTTWGSSNGIGFLLYPGLFLSLFIQRRWKTSVTIFATVILFFLAWVFLMKTTTPRYLYPVIPLAAVAAGAGYALIISKTTGWKKPAAKIGFAIVLLGTLFLSRYTFYYYLRDIPLALNPSAHYEYVLDNLYGGEDLPGAIRGLPAGSRVLSVDHKTFYLTGKQTPVHVGYPWNTYFFDYSKTINPEAMLWKIKNRGYTHVLYREGDGDFLFPGSPWGGDPRYEQYHFLYDFLEVYGVPVGGEDGDGIFGPDRLYKLHNEPVRPPRMVSERTGEGFDYPLERTPEAFKTDDD